MYEVVIAGGGPGGVAAGVYAARKKMKTVLVTDVFGGQSLVSSEVQNWIGRKSVSGFDLGKLLEEHLRAQEGIEIVDGDRVDSLKEIARGLEVTTKNGKRFPTRTFLLATGSRRKKLGIPGEEEFDGRGVSYCSICDAPLFKGKVVAVVGGGNSGLEAAIDLLPYATRVYLLHRGEALKGDQITQERIRREPNIEVRLRAEVQSIQGDEEGVKKLFFRDKADGTEHELAVEGIFVEIGSVPNSELVKDMVKRNEWGEVVVDHVTQRTSHPLIWAAGDVTDVRYKQNNISAGDAIKAILNIHETLRTMPVIHS